MQELMDQLKKTLKHVAWEVADYNTLHQPIRNALKSITGRIFESAKGYEEWWEKDGAKFEVKDD